MAFLLPDAHTLTAAGSQGFDAVKSHPACYPIRAADRHDEDWLTSVFDEIFNSKPGDQDRRAFNVPLSVNEYTTTDEAWGTRNASGRESNQDIGSVNGCCVSL